MIFDKYTYLSPTYVCYLLFPSYAAVKCWISHMDMDKYVISDA